MRVPRSRLNLRVSEQLSDHRQPFADKRSTRRKRVPLLPPTELPSPLCGPSAHPLVRVGRGPGTTTAGAVDLSRAPVRGRHLLVSQQLAGTDGTGDGAAGAALGRIIMTGQPTFPTLLEGFFTQRLMRQRRASVQTIASYRHAFRLLLQFAQKRLRKAPSTLALEDIAAKAISRIARATSGLASAISRGLQARIVSSTTASITCSPRWFALRPMKSPGKSRSTIRRAPSARSAHFWAAPARTRHQESESGPWSEIICPRS